MFVLFHAFKPLTKSFVYRRNIFFPVSVGGVAVHHVQYNPQVKREITVSLSLIHIWLADHLAPDRFLISLLSQYTPFYKSSEHPELNRRITSYEYSQVVEEALRLGFTNGFMQEKSSAKEEYTPPFDLTGID